MSRIFGQMFTASELSALPQGTNVGDMLRTAKNIGQRLLKTRDAVGLSQAEFFRTTDLATIIRDRLGISLDWIDLADQRSSTLCAKPRSSSRAGDDTTSAHHNTHLSMSLKRTGFADRDAIPRGALGVRVR